MRVITDKNWQEQPQQYGVLPRFIKYGSPEAITRGILPIGEYPDVLIPEDEWKERIAEAHEKKTMPIHHFEAAGHQAHDQGQTSYCWAYGITATIEALRLHEAQPYRRLGPASLGWLVNWKNAGYYLSETIAGAHERGIASAEYVADGIYQPSKFKVGWEQDALNHKPSEWFDLKSGSAMVKHCVSILLGGLPPYIAYNWWGHALMMAGIEWAEGELHHLKWIAWNSHGDGRIELVGTKGVPDEAYAPRSSTYSP